MIKFRTGRRNPRTIYVEGPTRERPFAEGVFIGTLDDERLVALAVEAMNAFVCKECPYDCKSCTLNSANCECYEHP